MPDHLLLEPLLDSWDRNNTITTNLLRAIPEGMMDLKVTAASPSIAQLFMHMHYVRAVFVEEDAPEIPVDVPQGEWGVERDRDRLTRMLADSATAVRDAVQARLASGRAMDRHYDHPILMLQHLIWHEGYHHGQIKAALKIAGRGFDDAEIGKLTWAVWMAKKAQK
jgi:uncharacterized damage-inducible protein DinB